MNTQDVSLISESHGHKIRCLFFSLFLCAFSISSVFSAPPDGFQKQKTKKLNVLLITIDTLRADRLSCYGSQHLKTPNIDRLASQGTLFSRAFAHTSTTLPSHANILLGTTPLHHGVHENINFVVRPELLTLAEWLKSDGYATGAFVGAYPLDSKFGLNQGFDVYDDLFTSRVPPDKRNDTGGTEPATKAKSALVKSEVAERKAEKVVDKALAWLRLQDKPWFLWVHCYDPHVEYDPPEPFKTQYAKNLYDGEVAYTDFSLGPLMKTIEEEEYKDSTLIIFTGDHGESLGEHGEITHGFFAYNTAIWIPLIISFPGGKPGRVEEIVGHTDIFPTICDLLEIKKPPSLQGLSLAPSMKGKRLPKRMFYFESLSPYFSRDWAPLRGYLDAQIKFIDSPIPEVYDLQKDFSEKNNLATEKELGVFQKNLDRMVLELLSGDESKAGQKTDRATLEKLESLGYLSSPQGDRKETYGPEDDVKVLLPYYYQSMDALDLCAQGKLKQGTDLLKRLIEDRSDMDIAYVNLAQVYHNQGKIKDALTVLELGLEAQPKSYDIFSRMVSYSAADRDYDRVIGLFDSANFRQIDFDPEIWNCLGLAYFNKGNLERALAAFNMALSLDARFPIVLGNMGTLYFYKYKRSKNPEDLSKSTRNFQKALEIDPYFGSVYYGLGRNFLELKDYDQAVEFFNRCIDVGAGIADAFYFLGIAHLKKGDKSRALINFLEFKKIMGHLLPPKDLANLNVFIASCEDK